MKALAPFSTALMAMLVLACSSALALDYDALGFSSPEASTLSNPAIMFSSSADSESLSVTVQDDLVYRYGYYSLDGGSWERFDLSGQDRYGDWIPQQAAVALSLSAFAFGLEEGDTVSDNYVVTYSCSYDSGRGGWDCRDDKWQLQRFNATLSVASPYGCVAHDRMGCMGGDAYWFDSCHHPEELIDACAVNETCLDGACVAEDLSGDVVHVEDPGEGNDIASNLLDAWNRASDGDIILLPKGNFTFDGTLRLGYPDHELTDVHIKGRGMGAGGTKLYRDYQTEDNEFFMAFVARYDGEWFVEVSDIWFEGPRPRTPEYLEGVCNYGVEALHFYHYHVYLHDSKFRWFNRFIVNIAHKLDSVHSVAANNVFVDNACYRESGEWHGAAAFFVKGADGQWPDVTPGTENFVFIEDNYLEMQQSGVGGGTAGRYVFRHNVVERMVANHVCNMHPAQPDWVGGPDYYEVATRFVEMYNNVHYQTPHDDPVWNGRGTSLGNFYGGEAVVWGNTIHEPDMGVVLGQSSHWFDCYDDSRAPSDWTIPDYPIPYQTGYMSGAAYSETHTGTDPVTYGEGDLFIWNNTLINRTDWFHDRFGYVNVHTSCQEAEGYIEEGRDYHVDVPRPGYEPYEYPHPRRVEANGGCLPRDSSRCLGGDVYWYDSCGMPGDVKDVCAVDESCFDGKCVPDPAPDGDVIHVEDPGDGNDIRPNLEAAWDRSSVGDTILLPRGDFVFSGNFYRHIGEDPDRHIKGRGSGSNGTRLYRNSETSDFMFEFVASTAVDPYPKIEVSDIYFEAMETRLWVGDSGTDYGFFNGIRVQNGDLWIHDCKFQYFSGSTISVQHKQDYAKGVISNNEFVENVALEDDGTHSNGYAVHVGAANTPDEWVPVSPGTGDFIYVEDNYYRRCRMAAISGYGGLFVFRHNFVELGTSDTGKIDMHGARPDWGWDYPYSARFSEVYGNTFIATPEVDPLYVDPGSTYDHLGPISFKGGESIIHSNVFKDYSDYSISLRITDAWASSRAPDDYEIPDYPTPYQIGYESGINYGENHTGTDSSTYGKGDCLIWNNTYDDSGILDVRSEEYLVEGRDYHVGIEKPGYTPYEYPHPRRLEGVS